MRLVVIFSPMNTSFWHAASLATLVWLFVPTAALAAGPLRSMDVADLDGEVFLAPVMSLAGGVDPQLSPEEVVSRAGQMGFKPADRESPQFSSGAGDVWFRFSLTNSSDEVRSAKLALRSPYLERADLFEIRPDGGLRQSSAGAAAALTGNAVSAAYPAFHLHIGAHESLEYFVRARSSTIILLPVTISDETSYSIRMMTETVLWSLIAGAALAFAMYAASVSFNTGNSAFGIYICFALSAALYILLSSGLLNALIGRHVEFNFSSIVFFAQAMMMAFATMFIMAFLDMEKQAPRLRRVFYVVAFISVLSGIGFLLPAWVSRIVFFTALGAGPIILFAGLAWMSAQGIFGARSVLIAWLPCFLATVWVFLRLFELTPYLPINRFLLPLAFAFSLAYLSAIQGGQVRQGEFWANSDALTGLGNRRLLDNLCELESRQTSERYGAAVAIDLDGFKPINDQFGHEVGDALLVSVAEKLRAHFGGRGDIFRTGGDEFLILGYHWQSRMEIITHASAFQKSLQAPLQHEDCQITAGASIGIAFHDHRTGFQGMLRQADAELYHVKSNGRGGIRIADQRQRDRRRSEPVIFADNDETDERVARMFGTSPRI